MIKTDVAIIGAGFAGIAAGFAAKEKKFRATLFEADDEWGGLCGNFSVDGFRFDKAVHLSFNEPPLVKRLFLSQPHYAHSSESRNYADGSWVRHPVQNNLRELPVEERIKVICGFTRRPELVDGGGGIIIINSGWKFNSASISRKNIPPATRANIGERTPRI